jgi:predicted DNA-binding protein with PD1-like motif
MLLTVQFEHMFKSLALTALMFRIGSLASPQQSHREVQAKPRPTDTKPNSSAVPDAFAVTAHFQRIVIFRFKYNTDLLPSMEKIVREQKIKNAVILSAIGSVRNYSVHSVAGRNFPSKDIYVKDPTAPANLNGMNGYILNGHIHAHVTLTDGDKAFGGHLEPGTNVFTFVIVTVGVLDDNEDLSKLEDETWR